MRAATLQPTEREFQRQIVRLAKILGWLVYHPWLSVHSTSGFPDLVLVRPPRVIFAEIKTAGGKITTHQVAWLRLLGECPQVEAYLWRPDDWDTIVDKLARA